MQNRLIGFIESTLGNIVGSKAQTFVAELLQPFNRGRIIVRSDSVRESNWEANIKILGKQLPSSAGCCSSDNIGFEIYRNSQQGELLKVYGSDPVPDTSDPTY